ncbi:hypothetical protein BAUCODRAFT_123637 [Baudoinia panamericana UAMH 10762]|uniref:Uncharacterized protein n=1 Tax=Baudoinia panamericana (strain UAMH 10762) TaxID=717646 RepID=M2N7W1_BAUPA|nr:uncharacterized protein BAUCODRAFT_123637 [Baudoinia panamericana UAMH 10762]EMC95169.1 hypothetical protein BAUCODRAFT_123637 [Baudoinia panamericana UAMH 10762]
MAAQMAQRALKKAAPGQEAYTKQLQIPTVTEDDLLAFQVFHFGDDTKPENWFVDAETALSFPSELQCEDDNLGWYEDGTKRTLTDAQIAMFRHSELQQMLREREIRRDEDSQQDGGGSDDGGSPTSEVSSIEGDLLGLTCRPLAPKTNLSTKPPEQRSVKKQLSHSSRSEESRSNSRSQTRLRQEVPYDERHKRNWENFIDAHDPIHGSMTHRRLVRELDEQHEKLVDMDYG